MGSGKTQAELCVRPGRPEDEGFIAALSETAFHSYSRGAADWVAKMRKAPRTLTLVATLGDVPVGVAVVDLRTAQGPYGPFARPIVAHLDAIAVAPTDRRRGIATHLLAVAEGEVERRGALAISLMTAARNHPARRLFESMGFVVTAIMDGAYCAGERALLMHKTLAAAC